MFLVLNILVRLSFVFLNTYGALYNRSELSRGLAAAGLACFALSWVLAPLVALKKEAT